MNKFMRTSLLIFSCLLVLLVSGCLQTQELYIGNKVTAEKVELRKDAPQVGKIWTSPVRQNWVITRKWFMTMFVHWIFTSFFWIMIHGSC